MSDQTIWPTSCVCVGKLSLFHLQTSINVLYFENVLHGLLIIMSINLTFTINKLGPKRLGAVI